MQVMICILLQNLNKIYIYCDQSCSSEQFSDS